MQEELLNQNSRARHKQWLERAFNMPLILRARELLREKLPPNLVFHCPEHTDDVITETLLFGVCDGLEDRSLELLAVAAAYHDLGYIMSVENHEEESLKLAVPIIKSSADYSEQELALICRMIEDTKLILVDSGLRQVANSELSKYLLDGDLSNLGREDFFDKLELVRLERNIERDGFYKSTLGFVTRHRWQTKVAELLRGPTKAKNIAKLKQLAAQDEQG